MAVRLQSRAGDLLSLLEEITLALPRFPQEPCDLAVVAGLGTLRDPAGVALRLRDVPAVKNTDVVVQLPPYAHPGHPVLVTAVLSPDFSARHQDEVDIAIAMVAKNADIVAYYTPMCGPRQLLDSSVALAGASVTFTFRGLPSFADASDAVFISNVTVACRPLPPSAVACFGVQTRSIAIQTGDAIRERLLDVMHRNMRHLPRSSSYRIAAYLSRYGALPELSRLLESPSMEQLDAVISRTNTAFSELGSRW
jgi:hypothetical protein